MTARVFVVRLADVIEEEVVVIIEGHTLTCFMSVCPRAIEPGNTYEGSVSLWAADGLEVHEAADEPVGITRLGDGFRHRIVGVLHGSVLDAGVPFEDEMFSVEYRYLDGRTVVVEADRIQLDIE